MGYPDAIDIFSEKLNKNESGYTIEEELPITNGKFEGFLSHDNIDNNSILIYTGPNFTGDKVNNYFLSIPSDRPWKRFIKVFSSSSKVYVTYETIGDQVEAEDINTLQQSIIATQTEVERHKADLSCHIDNGVIDGGSFV